MYDCDCYGWNDYAEVIESDYIDATAIAEALKITSNSILGVTFGASPLASINALNKVSNSLSTSAKDYDYWKAELSTQKNIQGIFCDITLSFGSSIVDFNGYGDSSNKEFTSATSTAVIFSISDSYKLKGRYDKIYQALQAQLLKKGTVVKSNSNASVIKLGKNYALCFYSNNQENVFLGITNNDLSELDISSYRESVKKPSTSKDEENSIAVDTAAYYSEADTLE